jgi:hypothetical protein
MKQCSVCKLVQSNWDFAIRDSKTGKRHGYCYECQRNYCREYYKRNRSAYNERRYINQRKKRELFRRRIAEYLMKHQCVDCGESDIRVLEFDHVRGEKKGNVSEMTGANIAWQRIEAELAKCEIRCANCHRRKTAIDFGWYKDRGIGA